MKKLILSLLMITMLTGCVSEPVKQEEVTTVEEEITTTIETKITENIVSTITEKKTHEQNLIEDTNISKADMIINSINEIKNQYEFALLYDFDFDGVPEAMTVNHGMVNLDCEIYNLKDGHISYCGNIVIDDNYPSENTMNIKLYRDDSSKNFFYCSNPVDFVKNNSEEDIYGYYSGNLIKYVFADGTIQSEVLLNFQEDYSDEDSLKNYLNDCENYLNQYELIETIPVTALWNYESVKDGAYKEIVRRELKEKYGIE
ncbi:MAG: hypothetical protein IKL70_04480 [Oscillospiraceae bacterium]|nr:hypothetical protein [Oscillospiraceae bacterium]